MPFSSTRRIALCLMLSGPLAACAPGMPDASRAPRPAAPALEAGGLADIDVAAYRRARASGQTVLRIDAGRSLIAITVRRGGRLARLGHDHVVASRAISGFVAPEQGRADLVFRLDQLSVDEARLRAEAGLDTQPPADAIEGTRHNMLTRVLEAERFPIVRIHAERGGGADVLRATISLHGVSRAVELPVRIEATSDATSGAGLSARGALTLLQSDFGITPFSVLGGAIAVRDQLELRFHIVASER